MNNHRETLNQKIDAEVFKHTAAKTKKINVEPKIMRGGTRL